MSAQFDVVVPGTGSGGHTAALRATQAGKPSTALPDT